MTNPTRELMIHDVRIARVLVRRDKVRQPNKHVLAVIRKRHAEPDLHKRRIDNPRKARHRMSL